MKQMFKVFGYPLYTQGLPSKISSEWRSRLQDIEFNSPALINTDFDKYPFVGAISAQIDDSRLGETGYIAASDMTSLSKPDMDLVFSHLQSEEFPEDIRTKLQDIHGQPFYFYYWG